MGRKEFIEAAQELLDAGHSQTKVANLLDSYHHKIKRLLKRGELEIYEAFDEDAVEKDVAGFEWLLHEDALDSIAREAIRGEVVLAEDRTKEDEEVSTYCKEKYGSLFKYLEKRHSFNGYGHDVLCENIYKTCSLCNETLTLDQFSPKKLCYLGVSASCRGCLSKKTAEYYSTNYERMQIHRQKRRAWLMSLPSTLTEDEWDQILSDFNHRCALCCSGTNISLDHYIPLSWGWGGTTKNNSIPLCRSCNSRKRNSQLPDSPRKTIIERYLAKKNDMTAQEFRQYVDWCESNKRPVEEVV